MKSSQPDAETSILPWISAGIAAALVGVYLLLFLAVPVGDANSPVTRFQLYLLLLAPDDVVRNAIGSQFRWQGILDRVGALGWAALAVLHAAWIGWWPLKWIGGAEDRPWWERSVLAAGIGLHLASLLTLGVGLLGLLRTPALAMVMTAAAVVLPAVAWCIARRKGAARPVVELPRGASLSLSIEDRLWWAGAATAGLFAAVTLLGSSLPPWDFDVLEYHLQVPKEWYQSGRIEFLPHNIYANMPLDAEMAPLAAMSVLGDWWSGAIAGKTVMGVCSLLTAIAIYGLVRRLASPVPAMAAALVWLSHPWVIHVSISGLNEQVYALYLTLAVSSIATKDATWRNWLLAGFFAGAAAACKYPAVIMLALPLAAGAAIAPRLAHGWSASRRTRLAAVCCFILAAALSGGGWYAKNWMQAGNPVYPLLGNVLGGKTRSPEKNAQFARGHAVPPYTPGKMVESFKRIGWRSEHQSPLLVPLAVIGVAAVVGLRQRAFAGVLGLLLFFVASWWLVTHRLDRFLVPAIPLAAALGGLGVEYALARPLRWALVPLLGVGLLYCLVYVCQPMPLAILALPGDNRWLAPLEELRRDTPSAANPISRVNEDIRWLNANHRVNQAVLCVGEAAVFDLEGPVYYHTCFDDCQLVNWMAGKSAAERKQALRDKRIGWVYIDWAEIERYRAEGNYGFDPRFSPALVNELVLQGVLLPPLVGVPPGTDGSREVYSVAP